MSVNYNGIDVSKYQGNIDWAKVKAAGIKFAMVRVGYGSYTGDTGVVDPYFEKNIEGAISAGVDVGCYFYSYAQSAEAAGKEAQFVLKTIEKYKGKILYPIAYDIEDNSQAKLGKTILTNMVNAFCTAIENAGYYAMFYCNANWAKNYLNMTALARFDLWLAEWRDAPTYNGHTYNMWQKTSKGSVAGINGNVDLDVAYMDFAAVIKEKKLNGYGTTPAVEPVKKTVDEIATEVLAGKWGNGADRKAKLEAAGYNYDDVQAVVNAKLGIKEETPKKSVDEIANEVLAGKWGNGADRKNKLEAAGYDYNAVQDAVNKKLGNTTVTHKKSIDEIANEVIAGKWGNGNDRRNKLTAAGYNYDEVQAAVEKKLGGTSKKSNEEIAKEVIAGKWGNGNERKSKLEAAGYNYNTIQNLVNKMI